MTADFGLTNNHLAESDAQGTELPTSTFIYPAHANLGGKYKFVTYVRCNPGNVNIEGDEECS